MEAICNRYTHYYKYISNKLQNMFLYNCIFICLKADKILWEMVAK